MIDIKNINLKRNYEVSFEEFFWATVEGHPKVDEFRERYKRASDVYYKTKFKQSLKRTR